MKKILLPLLSLLFVINVQIFGQDEKKTFTFRVGEFEVTLLSEGQKENDTKILLDPDMEIVAKYAPNRKIPAAVNAFLVKMPNKNVLIDAGYGQELIANLATRHVKPEQVDLILLTHAHGDHVGGLVKDEQAVFPNAKIYMARAEYEYWTNEERRMGSKHVRQMLKAYEGRIELFEPGSLTEGGTVILPGIKAISTPGHTPGHTAFLVESKDSKLLVWGDLTHAMVLQIPHPEIAVSYDVDPVQATATRKAVFEYLVKYNIPAVGMHVPYPAGGTLKKNGTEYSFDYFNLKTGL